MYVPSLSPRGRILYAKYPSFLGPVRILGSMEHFGKLQYGTQSHPKPKDVAQLLQDSSPRSTRYAFANYFSHSAEVIFELSYQCQKSGCGRSNWEDVKETNGSLVTLGDYLQMLIMGKFLSQHKKLLLLYLWQDRPWWSITSKTKMQVSSKNKPKQNRKSSTLILDGKQYKNLLLATICNSLDQPLVEILRQVLQTLTYKVLFHKSALQRTQTHSCQLKQIKSCFETFK